MRQRLWFQSDGTPAYYGEDGRQWLNATYPGELTGRRGPIALPSLSPNLISMDVFLWGQLEKHDYAASPRTREDFVARLQSAVTVSVVMATNL
jgi:hypothetical protein